ncbi:MAG: AbrB family transcriptional regulator [Gammaproteobacteria bacterium]|nr:AbrB family transcriptional regulator [Gammaproteobacteria bacterium]
MSSLREVAAIGLQGQVTLPKSIREALGVDCGSKIVFDLSDSHVVVTRADDTSHQDPAIGAFLKLLENDIRNGRHLATLPQALEQALLAAQSESADLSEDIEGHVEL